MFCIFVQVNNLTNKEMKYKMLVTKIVTHSVEVEVEAINIDSAKNKAEIIAKHNDKFTEDEVVYIVEPNN